MRGLYIFLLVLVGSICLFYSEVFVVMIYILKEEIIGISMIKYDSNLHIDYLYKTIGHGKNIGEYKKGARFRIATNVDYG